MVIAGWKHQHDPIGVLASRNQTCMRHQREVDAHRTNNKHPEALGVDSDGKGRRLVAQSRPREPILNGTQLMQFEHLGCSKQLGTKPTLPCQPIQRVGLSPRPALLLHLAHDLIERLDIGEFRMHYREGALVIGANTNLKALIDPETTHSGNLESPMLGNDLTVLGHDLDIISLEQ